MHDLEDQLRSVLHERADDIHPSSRLSAQIDARLRRSQRGRRLTAAGVAAALLLGAIIVSVRLSTHHQATVRVGTPTGTTALGPTITGRPSGDVPLDVVPGSWARTAEPPFTDAFASVWTGAQLFVAFRPAPGFTRFATYDPARNGWQTLPDPPVALAAPLSDSSTFAWTGTTVLVWGQSTDTNTPSDHHRLLSFTPVTGRWTLLADPPIVSLIQAHPIWTGRELIVWGGHPENRGPAVGAAYDPAHDRWRTIAAAPLSTRENPMIVWTGREMIAFGGLTAAGDRPEGAAYNPTTNTWRSLPPSGLAATSWAPAVWTGREMFVLSNSADLAAYDPAANRWRRLDTWPLSPREQSGWVWTGRALVVWGGITIDRGRQTAADGAAYDLGAKQWRVLPPAPIGARDRAVVSWTGGLVVVVGGYGPSSTGASLEPAAYGAAAYRP